MARRQADTQNGTRVHATFTAAATDADATKLAAMVTAKLCGPLDGDGNPTADEGRHFLRLTNVTATVAYLYHANNATNAIAGGTPIPASAARPIEVEDKTPAYVFAASGTCDIRVERVGR